VTKNGVEYALSGNIQIGYQCSVAFILIGE
jgi:hypothetical protein